MSAEDVNTIASRMKTEFIDFDSQENMVTKKPHDQGIIVLFAARLLRVYCGRSHGAKYQIHIQCR